jgi:hypothetical protein
MVLAIFIMSILSVSLVTLAVGFAQDASRTRLGAEDAQLRQILLAGADDLRAKISAGAMPAGGAGAATVESALLPQTLRDQQAGLAIAPLADDSANARSFEFTATMSHRQLAEKVRFAQQNGVWMLAGAEMQ